jgi:predicted Na+-dependent transporter
MTPRRKSSLLWGVVGALAFLVLVQGYRLVVGPFGIDPLAIGAVALCVGTSSAGLTHVLAARIPGNGRS